MNTIMVIVLKVLFSYGLSLSYIMIHLVVFQYGPTNVSNLGKGIPVLYCVPPLPRRRGLGRDIFNPLATILSKVDYLFFCFILHFWPYLDP